METTAAMPKTMDAMNKTKRVLLALASRQAILKSQRMLILDFEREGFKVWL